MGRIIKEHEDPILAGLRRAKAFYNSSANYDVVCAIEWAVKERLQLDHAIKSANTDTLAASEFFKYERARWLYLTSKDISNIRIVSRLETLQQRLKSELDLYISRFWEQTADGTVHFDAERLRRYAGFVRFMGSGEHIDYAALAKRFLDTWCLAY